MQTMDAEVALVAATNRIATALETANEQTREHINMQKARDERAAAANAEYKARQEGDRAMAQAAIDLQVRQNTLLEQVQAYQEEQVRRMRDRAEEAASALGRLVTGHA